MALHPTTYARIDLGALVHNYLTIKEAAKTNLLCIVKADGYGHGASACAKALYQAGARHFGVANPSEALSLRKVLSGKDAMILILGYSAPEDIPLLVEHGITQTVFSAEYAEAIAPTLSSNAPLHIHVKLDTGMNRLGFSAREEDKEQTLAQISALKADPRFVTEGIFTHFACADEPESGMTDAQAARFTSTVSYLEEAGISFPIIHACNSAGIYRAPHARFGLVRAGIILYGVMPSAQVQIPGLIPVMSLHTHVTHIHTVKKGETVGYGATFTAERDMTLATLAIGYADGLIRAYAPATVRIHDTACPIIGRICMDQCMVDVTGLHVTPGTLATFFDEVTPVTALSDAAHMIPYETLCLIGKRVPRIEV